MSDPKKPPQPFSTNLFSSPGGSSSLSFGLDQPFSSPFSLAPAQASKPDQHDGGTSLTVQTSSTQQLKTTQGGTPPARQSPVTSRRSKSPQQAVSVASTSSTELSTVPLDSPTTASTNTTPSVSTGGVLRSATVPAGISGVVTEGGTNIYGWNDPPMLRTYAQTPNRPTQSMSAPTQGTPALNASLDEQFQIQPLAGLQEPSGVPPPTSVGHPPVASVSPIPNQGQGPPPPAQDKTAASSNPYRYGAGFGTTKLAYGSSGIASFGGSSGAPPTSAQPVMLPSQLFEPPPPAVGGQVGTQPGPPPSNQGVVHVHRMPVAPTSQATPYSAPPIATPQSTQFGDQSATSSMWNAQPVRHHWFYLRSEEKYWIPFSLVDSNRLEETLISCSHDSQQQVLVPTDGGRYDVDLHRRTRHSIYWEEPVSWVRRCSWFYKGEDDRWYLPYDEMTAHKLEEEYLSNLRSGIWNKQMQLSGGEYVVMHSHSAIVHYPSSHHGMNIEEESSHPKSVLRGFAEIEKVETGEQSRIDHLVFVVHGIGAHHDLNFRSLVDCVDDFREVAQLMLKTHTFTAQAPQGGDSGGRVEFLPIHWHTALHGDDTGVDTRLKPLTLPSITRLRDFTNSTLLDILYFTSPIYCQTIISQVATEMNRMWELFKTRNPSFQGNVSLIGHSLGSCVLFDLLDHQHTSAPGETKATLNPDTSVLDTSATEAVSNSTAEVPPVEGGEDEPDKGQHTIEEALSELGLSELSDSFKKEQIDYDSLLMCTSEDLKELGIPMGPRKKLISYIAQQMEVQRQAKERREQEAVRRLAKEKEQQRQQDQREAVDAALERLTLQGVKIVKGLAGTGQPFIEYPQLNFPTQHLFTLGSPIGLFLTVRGVEELGPNFSLPTCSSVFNIFHPFDPVAYRMEPLVSESAPEKPVLMPHHKGRKRFHLELYENLGQVGASIKHHIVEGMRNMWQQLNEFARSHSTLYTADQALEHTDTEPEAPLIAEVVDEVCVIGELNQGRRVDYVLQEKPIEKLNEYLFALSSHLCYWRSEDTALFILKEVYNEPNPQLTKS